MTSATSGTKPTDNWGGPRPGAGRPKKGEIRIKEKGLKTTDLREIINLCQSTGISRLKVGGLEIDFRGGSPFRSEIAQQPVPVTPDRLDVQDRELLAELDLTQRMLDDPLGYEQQMIDEHTRGHHGQTAEDR